MRDMWPPFWEGRSLTAGDIDNDGDHDVILASTVNGLYIYNNNGQGQFSRHPSPLEAIRDLPIFNAALVDLNNDGWLDIFFTTYKRGNFILWNKDGAFTCLLYTSPSPRDLSTSRMPSSA